MSFRRLAWLLISAVLPFLFLRSLSLADRLQSSQLIPANVHNVIINEWSQGDGGFKEWVELLVVDGPIDLRGWNLGDETAGDLTFAYTPLWSHVQAGSLILIYNQSDPDTLLPDDDYDLGDCVVVIPDEDPVYFIGRLPIFTNDKLTDNPHLRDETNQSIHDFSVDPGPDYHPDAQQVVRYDGNSKTGVSNGTSWSLDAAIAATPGSGNGGVNSSWIDDLCLDSTAQTDLSIEKSGPDSASPGGELLYQLTLNNNSSLTATGVILTDVLPLELSYTGDDSGFPISQPNSRTLVWNMGSIPATTSFQFSVTTTVSLAAGAQIMNEAMISTNVSESNLTNNSISITTVISKLNPATIIIDAVLYDGYESNHLDEAVLLKNLGDEPTDMGGWRLNDGEATSAVIPAGTVLSPGDGIWLAKQSTAFKRQFGFLPDFEVEDSPSLLVPNLSGGWPQLADDGDQVILYDGQGQIIDCLVYEAGGIDDCVNAWQGESVHPYTAGTLFAQDGQILYRRRDQITGLPVPDTDSELDWAQTLEDVINGRKVRYPGWDLDHFFMPTRITETAIITVAIAPDNAFQAIKNEIDVATRRIQLESMTFENIAIANALIEALGRGVSVTLLLEGGPAGGITEQERHVCQQLELAGGQCWFMINESGQKIFDRYRFLHAKFAIIDDKRAIISSENLSPHSLPDDDKTDGTWGRRGVILITDAPSVISHLQTVFASDFDSSNHVDLFRWESAHPIFGEPAPGFVPITETGGITYAVRHSSPQSFAGLFTMELIQSPENSLRDQDSLLGLVNQATEGDILLVQQLSERPFWGDSTSNATEDPNPRLEAFIDAARRGTSVRILLDGFFDDAGSLISNAATCLYLRDIARHERLPLQCALSNPTGLGIHNKMVLARISGRGYVQVGSINGTEMSNKGNRELALQIQSDGIYTMLARMFDQDWPHRIYMPLLLNDYRGHASYPLISEILYDPPGQDDDEFIELANPTGSTLDLSHYSLGDAVHRDDFEDVRRFPAGTSLAPREALVVATSASAFLDEYGFRPDFEILSTDSRVPDLIDDESWGDPAAILQLGNVGDEVILRDPADRVVDVVSYGSGSFPGVITCSLALGANASLERHPFWRDTDDCEADFREWPFPTPGSLP